MQSNIDFKKEWEKTKKQLEKLGKEAAVLAKKGEEELIKISRRGKLHLDSTAIGLKIEKLYYFVGKEYVKSIKTNKDTKELSKFYEQLLALEKEQQSLKKKIKSKREGAKNA